MSLALGALTAFGRRTVTGMLCATGQQHRDWSAAHRLFSRERVDTDILFDVARREVLDNLSPNAPLVVAIDDTLIHKTGKKVHGVSYRRDPLGPAFHTNFVWSQRFLQFSAALPATSGLGPATGIPVQFIHAPTPRKPKKNAPPEQWEFYKAERKAANISRKAADHIAALRKRLDEDEDSPRDLWLTGDGSYTNGTVLKNLPPGVVLIGRVRKDARLHYLPEASEGRGRKRVYGDLAPTPEALRQDANQPWQTVPSWAAGKLHDFRVKTLAPLKWRTAGAELTLRLIVIAPLGYRLRNGGPLLYRQPAYLICTDPEQPIEKVLQAYLWRWSIEVNHRDEKQLIGVGEAQVRDERATGAVPAFLVANYAFLKLAACRAFAGEEPPGMLPPPKWNTKAAAQPASTTRLIQQLRAELWGKELGLDNFSGFIDSLAPVTKPEKIEPQLKSAVLYATA